MSQMHQKPTHHANTLHNTQIYSRRDRQSNDFNIRTPIIPDNSVSFPSIVRAPKQLMINQHTPEPYIRNEVSNGNPYEMHNNTIDVIDQQPNERSFSPPPSTYKKNRTVIEDDPHHIKSQKYLDEPITERTSNIAGSSQADIPIYNRPERAGIKVDLIRKLNQYDNAKNLAHEEYNRNRHRMKQNVISVLNTDKNSLVG